MGLESAVISAGTLGAYAWGLLRYGAGARASGLAFHTLTVAQLLHALLCRSEDAGLYKHGRPRNRYLDLALGISLAAHAGTALLPPLRRLMGAAPLSFADLPVLAAGTLGPLLINDRLKRRTGNPDSPSGTEPEDTP
jgi:Ca2+-transporting ATPase